MSSTSPRELIPKDLNDVSSITTIQNLDGIAFAGLVPLVLDIISAREPTAVSSGNFETPFCTKFTHLLRQRAREPVVVSTITSLLTQSPASEDDLRLVSVALWGVVSEISEDAMLSYRDALAYLSAADSDGCSDSECTDSLAQQVKGILRFMDNRADVWVPEHKGDCMATRSLKERVHTAREMRPHLVGLLGWLRDRNWPPCAGCEAQLARFPEITIMPIRKILIDHRGDGEWVNNLLLFVQDHVPVGRNWEAMYPQVKALVDCPTGDEEENETSNYAKDWIKALDTWRSTQEGLRCA
ncbi:hypothetical protein SCUP515_09114 [Seiridium cupressi]